MAKVPIEVAEADCERCIWTVRAHTLAAAIDALIDHHGYAHEPIQQHQVSALMQQSTQGARHA